MPVKARNYKALTGQGEGEAKNYTLAEMGDLFNDNILTNSDFKSGIINQKGQTSYVGNGSNNFYTIDMWYATKNVTVTVHDGYVNFKNNTTETNYVIQILDEQPDENYCGAVNVKSIVGTCFLRTQDKAFTKLHEDLNLVKGLNIISFNGAVERTGIYLGANASIDVEFIKLEKGSYFTGMSVWNEALELRKCQYYYQTGNISGTFFTSQKGQQFIQSFNIPQMKKTPSITFQQTDSYGISGQSVASVSNNTLRYSWTKNDNTGGARFGMNWQADAYDY